ncbi:MAG TPA: protein disulfide oxidoreductase [Sulfurovum sp.]|uniref:protein disulfide oxidoreductase n=1 Tax=Sulfurovum sp. TaxID=1969726 RepID=UPI002F9462EF
MKKWNIRSMAKEIALILVLLVVLSNIISYLRKPELSSTKLPQIEAKLLDGNTFKVQEGKPLLVYFWAEWCPTCKWQSPNIETIAQSYNVLTIAVNSGSDEAIKRHMRKQGLSFKVVNDWSGTYAKAFNVEVYPTVFMYDRKGELKFTEVGYTTTAGLLARLKWLK